MSTKSLALSRSDLKFLKDHLAKSTMSPYNQEKLSQEIREATVYADEELPNDVVCLHSEARISNMRSGKVFTFRIVKPEEANIKAQKVSVFAPISIALFGYRTGDTISWEMPDGIQEFRILEVKRLA